MILYKDEKKKLKLKYLKLDFEKQIDLISTLGGI